MAALVPEVAVAVAPVAELLAERGAFRRGPFAQRDDGLGGSSGLGIRGSIDRGVRGVVARASAGAEQQQTGKLSHPPSLTTSARRASGPNRHETQGITGEK